MAVINPDGSLDTRFNPPVTGLSGAATTIAILDGGRVFVGGNFTTAGGESRSNVAVFNADGSLDAGFKPTVGSSVLCSAVQPDGRIVIGGSFTTLNGATVGRIARLNPDGTVDATFAAGTGASGNVQTLAVQPDGRILVAGAFTTFQGVARARVARLGPTGSVDLSFLPTPDFSSGTVYGMLAQEDGGVLLRGSFAQSDQPAVTRGLVRLLPDGARDPGFYAEGFGLITSTASPTIGMNDAGRLVLPSLQGGVESTIAVPVPVVPTITTQPQAQVAVAGSAVNLSVVAGGSAPLVYQWRKDGLAIAGATGSVYSIASSTVADSGSYDVVVSNPVGAAVSVSVALTVVGNDFTYVLRADGAVITGYSGAGGAVTVPSVLEGRPVVEIGDSALIYQSSITALTLPPTLTRIGYSAFRNCTGITTITIPPSVASIGSLVFYGCSALSEILVAPGNLTYSSVDGVLFRATVLVSYPEGRAATAYSVPMGTTALAEYCLARSKITAVTIAPSVLSIGTGAFSFCGGLGSIDFPASVNLIAGNPAQGSSVQTFTVDPANPNYASQDGLLLNKSRTALLAYPSGRRVGFFEVPAGITEIGPQAFR
ncbi:MAG: hypothetical protein EBU81_10190, partial [Proteobacteria bacterium]|nr:hypothetical protein [Pseudomonadota bacterium]